MKHHQATMKDTKIWFMGLLSILLTIIPVNPKAAVTSEHPRLFFNGNQISTLQTRAASTHQEIWHPIKEYVDSQLKTAPPSSAPPDGNVTTYRNAGNQLLPLAFACVITAEADHCQLAKTYLLTYATWEQWDQKNRRDLGLAHMLLGNALAYDWLYNQLTPAERQTVRINLANWAQKMYEASLGPKNNEWNNWWHKSYIQNHYSTNNSALGMAGLALLGEDERAQTWIDQAGKQMSRIQSLLNGIEDGSWHEGIPYQNYALTLSLPFLVNLKKIQGTDRFPHNYLRNYPYWRLYNHLPNSTQFVLSYGNFKETNTNPKRPQNILRFTANEYDDGYAEWIAQQLIAADSRHTNVYSTPWYVFEFLYYDPGITAQSPTDLATTRVFPDLAAVIWRTGWGDDDLVFGLKSGAYGGRFAFDTFTNEVYPWESPCADIACKFNFRHGHDDTNSFYIHRAGQWLAPENVGVGLNDSALHNTLLIDGTGQYRPSDDEQKEPEAFIGSDGFLEATANTPHFDYVAADATRRFKNIPGIEDVTRHVLFVRPDYFVMLDNVAADAAHQYTWVSHFGRSVSVEGNWVRGEANNKQILGVGIASPLSFQISAGNDGKPYVHIQPPSPAADMRFINVLYPTDQAAWDVKPALSLLEDNGEAAAASVQWKNGRRDLILLTYAKIIATRTLGAFQFDAQVAVVARDSQGKPDKLFVYGGTFVKDQAQDTVLVTNLDRDEPFEAIYFDQTVAVGGNIVTEVTLYAPQAQRLLVNGRLGSFSRSGDHITFDGSDPGTLQPPTNLKIKQDTP